MNYFVRTLFYVLPLRMTNSRVLNAYYSTLAKGARGKFYFINIWRIQFFDSNLKFIGFSKKIKINILFFIIMTLFLVKM